MPAGAKCESDTGCVGCGHAGGGSCRGEIGLGRSLFEAFGLLPWGVLAGVAGTVDLDVLVPLASECESMAFCDLGFGNTMILLGVDWGSSMDGEIHLLLGRVEVYIGEKLVYAYQICCVPKQAPFMGELDLR